MRKLRCLSSNRRCLSTKEILYPGTVVMDGAASYHANRASSGTLTDTSLASPVPFTRSKQSYVPSVVHTATLEALGPPATIRACHALRSGNLPPLYTKYRRPFSSKHLGLCWQVRRSWLSKRSDNIGRLPCETSSALSSNKPSSAYGMDVLD
jgi:hypothetical protein